MGGHGSVAFSLLDADKNREWAPLLGFLGIEPLSQTYVETCTQRGYPFEYFPATPGKPWRTWPRIARWLNIGRPDAIILHSVSALLPCVWQARRLGVPLVVVEHQPNSLKSRSEWVFSHLAMLLSDHVVILTPDYAGELKRTLGIFYSAGKVRVIPNGVDTKRFSPVGKFAMPDAKVRLGMAARFTSMKRQDVLVKMLVELRRSNPQTNWQLSLAGGGESWERIRQMVLDYELADYVDLPGQLDEAQLIKWYQSQDIYLHASEGETLSTSLLQAMASALPIVASDVPGIRNLLTSEPVCGVLIRDQSPHGFAKAVIGLVKDKTRAANLAHSGRALSISNYSQDEMFSKYAKVLNND
jgi:glycosyltransferase involved in cell wall biosynthesis